MEDVSGSIYVTSEEVWDQYYDALGAHGWTVEAFEAIDDEDCGRCHTQYRIADVDEDHVMWDNWVDEAQGLRFLLGRTQ